MDVDPKAQGLIKCDGFPNLPLGAVVSQSPSPDKNARQVSHRGWSGCWTKPAK